MYKSPIEVAIRELENKIINTEEGRIMNCVHEAMGVIVDKDELMRALNYDRNQYEKGYQDGKLEALPQWISVKDKMPVSGESVWVRCEIRHIYGGKDYYYTCEAFYADQYTIVEPNGYDYNVDYSEEDDEYYLAPGWYEAIHNANDYSCIPIEDFVTHWMPLPDPPEEVCTKS